ncbi:MAG: ABC transporter permease [Phycisphaerae bacterium]
MRGIWAIARQTFSQCLRTKVAAVFIVLLTVCIGTLPFVMTGDGTLPGRIRTFLAYAPGITGALLTLATVFLSVGAVSSDVERKHIFTIASKPLSRWHYVLGRWLGVVMLNALLVTVSAAGIYSLAQYLRMREAPPDQRRAVETEIFTARVRSAPVGVEEEIRSQVEQRIRKLQEENRYEENVERFLPEADGDEQRARELLAEEIYKQELQQRQSVSPGGRIQWTFESIDVEGGRFTGTGEVRETAPQQGLARVEAPDRLLSRLVYRGPVRVAGVEGRVLGLSGEWFDVAFESEDDMRRARSAGLETDREVDVVVDETIQLTYRLDPLTETYGENLPGAWIARNPRTGFSSGDVRDDPSGTPSTVTLSSRVVDEESGRTIVRYFNRSDFSIGIQRENLGILFRVGGFEWNFIRGMFLILVQVSFIAALGVFAGTFLSFAVGSLVCLAVLPFAMLRGFLAESTRILPATEGIGQYIGRGVFYVMDQLLPNFSRTSPTESFVDGMLISWPAVGETVLWALVVRSALILLVACIIFNKRELARVQV